MSATSSPSDKFLFLFTTDSDDLDSVRNVLQTYYNYPSAAANTYTAAGCANFKSTFKTLVEKLCGTDPSAPVYQMPDANGKVPSGETNMLSLVIVISGDADISGMRDTGGGTLTWSEIRQTISGILPQPSGPPKTYPYQLYCEINVIFASPYCNSFMTEWDTSVPVTSGTLVIPQTVADLITQAERETFLGNIANALQLGSSISPDPNGRISFNDIAASIHGAPVASYFRSVGAGVSGKYFPGYSYLEIHDGSPDWWESDDIYINYYNNDIYNPNAVNTIYVNIHLNGTHPVNNFWIGAKHFGSGLGAADAIVVANLRTSDATLPSILTGGNSFLYHYDLMFVSSTTHRCVRAVARFGEISLTDIDDYSEWSVVANPDEAQRNIDPMSPSPSPPMPIPLPRPDDAQNPDPDPQPGDDDQNNPGDRSLANIRGFKEHIYSVLNTFRETRSFRIALRDEFKSSEKHLGISFFAIENRDARTIKPLKIILKPYPHIPLTLKPMEKADILFRLTMKSKVKIKKINLPLEILVEAKNLKTGMFRNSPFTRVDRKFVPVGGLTVKIVSASFSIRGRVLGRNGKPVAGAKVIIRTVNGLQAAVLKTDKEGKYSMLNINPDFYRMTVETRDWRSPYRVINLNNRDLSIDFREGKIKPDTAK